MGAPAGIELLSEGLWIPGSVSGEWSPGGCGCGSGEPCTCGGTCGCKGEGGGSCGGGRPSGEVPLLPDYDGEIWASTEGARMVDAFYSETWWWTPNEEGSSSTGDAFEPFAAPEFAVAVVPHEKVCGPDVTDFVVGKLIEHHNLAGMSPIADIIKVSGLGAINLRSQVKGLPNKPVAFTDSCPSNCPESIQMCGKCVSDQIPGNTALGQMFGKVAAGKIGEADANAKGETDSAEDIESYELGDESARIIRDNSKWAWGVQFSDRKKIKEEFCKAMAKRKFEDFGQTQNCQKCSDSWPKK